MKSYEEGIFDKMGDWFIHLFGHKWSKWDDVEDGLQKRQCTICGRRQTNGRKAGHDWAKWIEGDKYTTSTPGAKDGKGILGGFTVQTRHCRKCGEGQQRKHGWGSWKDE